MQAKKALGKGLASLIPFEVVLDSNNEDSSDVRKVPIDSIIPNRSQPRKAFNEDALKELSESIKANGIIQPLVVCPAVGGRYELVAGERRLRASKIAGLKDVPVIIRSVETGGLLELALIENVQREDLNAIEEALAYKELMENFDYSQEEVADKVGKSRTAVANTVRLLHLPKLIQEDVVMGRLTAGHARALLTVTDLQEQLYLRETVLNSQLTVRDIERMIQERVKGVRRKAKKDNDRALSPQLKFIADEMKKALGTQVHLEPDADRKGGKIIIEYYSPEELDNIYSRIIK